MDPDENGDLQQVDLNFSYVNLLNMVANQDDYTSLHCDQASFFIADQLETATFGSDNIENNIPTGESQPCSFSTSLPSESVDTTTLNAALSIGERDRNSEVNSIQGVSRCFSSFNKEDEECASPEVSSVQRPISSGQFEESMRKYCNDKSTVMFKPEIGMQFDSLEESFQFYNMYSWVTGFSIRYGDNYTNKKGDRTMQEYKCQREGVDKHTKISTTRCSCKAMLRVSFNESGKWFVKKFEASHTHVLVESCAEKKHLASHRQIDKHTKEMIKHLRENNVSLSRVNCIMGSFFGSMDKVPFDKKTLRTVCSNIAREAMEDDVQKTMESFRDMISRDPKFVFTAQLDEDDRLVSLMWTSGRSRSLYQHFGDVITFDTTYETNIYRMPFGMFVGVNNHFQSVIFAGVLLSNETADAFKWAFEEFVAMMGGKAPQTMLTDQSQSMTIAIKENLLGTNHRWCKWHILRKAQEVLGHVHKKHSTFSDDFNKVVNHMLTKEEFEAGWEYLINKYDLSTNPFMTRAYEVRNKWAKPYFNGVFCARMSSTQRSESANHVLKVYVPCKSSINLFVKQYAKLIDDREKADDEAEKNRKQKTSKPLFGYPIEKHASKIYTPSVFKLFKAELRKSSSYVLVNRRDPDLYEVQHVDADNRESWSRVNFTITVDSSVGFYKCQCGLFEHFGIICCHVMLVMTHIGLMTIPECHIMKRWTINARDGKQGMNKRKTDDEQGEVSRTIRHRKLYMSVLDLVSVGEFDDTTSDLAMKYIGIAKKKIADYRSTISRTCQVGYNISKPQIDGTQSEVCETEDSGDTAASQFKIFDREKNVGIDVSSIKPPIMKKKLGRPRTKRFLTRFDSNITKNHGVVSMKRKSTTPGGRTGVKQTRFCSCCRSATHDIRTCPDKEDITTQPRKKGEKVAEEEFQF